ncbi:hypothetical protein H8K33_05575 [Undibacterium amnicola]|uniref:Lipoprotein n=1 Tax=Undibacterium amnicola TaxID=1834038 RepID=A0ABR6XN83_9BURK|nr:hypothetical protein [Undibacterium amnicola]
MCKHISNQGWFQMFRLFFCSLILILTGCASTSSSIRDTDTKIALNFEKGPGPHNFECDASAGKYLQTNIATSKGSFHATGMLRFFVTRVHPSWSASASVTFVGTNEKFVGLQAIVMPDVPANLQFAITGQGGPQDRTTFGVTPLTDGLIPFDITIMADGELNVSIAGKSTNFNVGKFEPARLSLFCSTAFVQFSKVAVTQIN